MWSKHQAVISRSENEIGLGFIQHVDINEQIIKVHFPLVQEVKLYTSKSTILQRYLLRIGQVFFHNSQEEKVKEIVFEQDVAKYHCESGLIIAESHLEPELDKYLSPIEKLALAGFSHPKSYGLRKHAYTVASAHAKDRLSGPVSARINLLPHQVYIADKVSSEKRPRAILADEVGLGKTIEAGLIISSLDAIDRADRVLIVVPESLIHQWAQEFSTLFNSLFIVMNDERFEEEERTLNSSPFESNQKVIISIEDLYKSPKKAALAAQVHWDMLVVDEAHHLDWAPEEPSAKWLAVDAIAKKSHGLLLLTATPRQRGLATQFGLLHMIDPKRFRDFEDFVLEMELIDSVAGCVRQIKETKKVDSELRKELSLLFNHDKEIAQILSGSGEVSSEEIINKLIDRHGTGRVFFRNRKHGLDYFPTRNLHVANLKAPKAYHDFIASLDIENISQREMMDIATGRKYGHLDSTLAEVEDPRVLWLADYLGRSQEKVVVICSQMSRVLEVASKLSKILNLSGKDFSSEIMLFHEGMESVERDKGAALFAESYGPRVLITSEMGGEGRNFQFVKNLVLFDIPANPEKLEQRIGRLDRIGQGASIDIYLPVIHESPEQVLYQWYHKGLGVFVQSNPASGILLEHFGEDLLEMISCFFPAHSSFKNRVHLLDSLVSKTKKELKIVTEELEETRDILLEMNSFNEDKANELLNKIKLYENNKLLRNFLCSSFDFYGVDYGDYDKSGSLQVNFDSLSFVENLPKIGDDEQAVLVFNRQSFLLNRRSHYMTFSNPFMQSFIEKATKEQQGRFSVAYIKNENLTKNLVFQVIFTFEAKGPKHLELEHYLPFSMKEFCFDLKGNDASEILSSIKALSSFKDMRQVQKIISSQKFIDIFTKNMGSVNTKVQHWRQDLLAKALKRLEDQHKKELVNLRYMVEVNPSYSQEDIQDSKDRFNLLKQHISRAVVSFDALRVIFVNP